MDVRWVSPLSSMGCQKRWMKERSQEEEQKRNADRTGDVQSGWEPCDFCRFLLRKSKLLPKKE